MLPLSNALDGARKLWVPWALRHSQRPAEALRGSAGWQPLTRPKAALSCLWTKACVR